MKSCLLRSAAALITTNQKLVSEDLAKENDFLRQDNKILRSKLVKCIPLTDSQVFWSGQADALSVRVVLAELPGTTTTDGPVDLKRWLPEILNNLKNAGVPVAD